MNSTFLSLSGIALLLTLGFQSISEAQAETGALDPYLVTPYADGTLPPPVSVTFQYVPPETATDYPLLRQGTGTLSLESFSETSSTQFLSIDDTTVGRSGNATIGYIRNDYYGVFVPLQRRLQIMAVDCYMPVINRRDLNGPTFPIVQKLEYWWECGGFLPHAASRSYVATYHAPAIVTTADGNQIEAVKIVITESGRPWASYTFGYWLGLIDFTPAASTASYFDLTYMHALTLPPPVADGTLVEYNNTQDFANAPGGHYFYSSDPAEQTLLDRGEQGHFVRTGRSFKTGGYVPVCRFYGSTAPGPNSHFFSADQDECAGLKAMQKTPTPLDVQQWNSEGNGFYAVAAITDANGNRTCLSGTAPVYRAYNNAYQNGVRNAWDSNHRLSTNRADIEQVVAQGWSGEGIAFCVPQ